MPSTCCTLDFLNAFADACENHANATALVHDERELTYQQLDKLANRIANFVISLSDQSQDPDKQVESKPQPRIGICLDRSIPAIASMIGIMRAGGIFVPLDPEYPVQRLHYMVTDASIKTILCDAQYLHLFQSDPSGPQVELIDPKADSILNASSEAPATQVAADDLAYIMYTSGSTGNPKGVQIQHRALATYCWADIDIYHLQSSDRTLQFSTLNFDIAIEEIFPPLLVGSTVVIRPSNRSDDENELSSIVRNYEITALHLATAYWHEWVDLIAASRDSVPVTLRMVLATGEKVSPAHYQRWLSLCKHELLWCNAYGPTETTVTATVFIPPPGWNGESMPIGKPLLGYTAHILDADDRQLGVGETGDLYIGGTALSKGYLNLPEKTEAVFRTVNLPNKEGQSVPTRIYKTGDLARWLPDGNIEFAGRIDHQIKLGSYRIEPGEIEFHIGSHPDVLEALVSHDEVDGKKALVAYIATTCEDMTAATMADFLRDRLPAYMVPARYCFLESFPKTINGKIDRRRLPDPSTSIAPRSSNLDAPRNDLEQMLVELWKTVLGVSEIGIHDDFFAIGGSSLLVTRVIAGIRTKYDIAIPVRDFFANPTIASIAFLLAQRLNLPEAGEQEEAEAEAQRRALRSRLPLVDPFYFSSGVEQLFAVRYTPQHATRTEKRHGVLICQADGHEYARAHRNLQQLAIQLSATGFEVMRFDFSGCGNSTGLNSLATPARWQREILTAIQTFKERADLEGISVLGIRLGATLAALATDQCDASQIIQNLILWDPVRSGQPYLQHLDQMHQRSLYQVNDYQVRRTSDVDQSYGIELSEAKREQYVSLRLPQLISNVQHVTYVLSRDYLQSENLQVDAGQGNVIETDDEIIWHEPHYNHAAFSSPGATRAVLAVLDSAKHKS